MDRVFPRNLDELDKNDLKKAVNQLDEYIRYMREQIEWAVQVLMKLDNGTSVADLANRMARAERSIGTLNQEYTQVSTTLADKADKTEVVMLSSVVTTIDSTSTDDDIPTAKAVYDAINI
jgi:predicted  nucleic acid-binding Zn-ribbon protein